MKVFNIYFASGDMYTSAGKEESDAMRVLFAKFPELCGADLTKVELNRGYDESTD